jgi:hypothetical protein
MRIISKVRIALYVSGIAIIALVYAQHRLVEKKRGIDSWTPATSRAAAQVIELRYRIEVNDAAAPATRPARAALPASAPGAELEATLAILFARLGALGRADATLAVQDGDILVLRVRGADAGEARRIGIELTRPGEDLERLGHRLVPLD